MPPTSPVGSSSHIPSSTTCETCHLGTVPGGSIPAASTHSTPGSLFATPAPTTTQIHTGITANCSSCHDSNDVWMGVSAYPIAPTVLTNNAQYTGFQTRPLAAAGPYTVADAAHPTTGDCSQCHSGTSYFTGQAKPTGHIPTQQTCTTCHVVAGDFSVAGLAPNATLHTGITGSCITCHGPAGGGGAGPFAGCATQAGCASPPPITYQPKVPPLAAGGSPTAPNSATHIPAVGVECSLCHSKTVFTGFNTVPGATGMRGSTSDHNAVSASTCESCHEYPYVWYGVTIRTPGSTNHHGRTAGEDCTHSGCHTRDFSEFNTSARVRPLLRSALGGAAPRVLPPGLPGTNDGDAPAGRAFSHVGVLPGQCMTCHNGQLATGRPAKHLATRESCDACHRTTAWIPAQFGHQGVMQGQCLGCHNGVTAPGKPGGHFLTARSCDACHRTVGWVPVNYSHLSPLYRPAHDKTSCTSCHITNGEMIPRMLRGGPRPRPVPPN
ncbi:MAG: cytochrome c3 family protein [Burkholderiaceae bacterium]